MNFERRIAIAFLLCGLIWLAFDMMMPKPPPQVGPVEEQAAESLEKSKDLPNAEHGAKAPQSAEPNTDAVEVVHHEIRNNWLALKVSNAQPGGVGLVEEVDLLSQQFAGHQTAVDPFNLGGASTLAVQFADANTDFRVPSSAVYEVESATEREFVVVFRGDGVSVRQRLALLEGYQGKLEVEVENLSGREQRHRMHVRTRVGVAGDESRYNIKRGLCRTTDDFEYEDSSDVEDEPANFNGPVLWAGVDNKYFGTLAIPSAAFADCTIERSEDGQFVETRLGSSTVTLAAGATQRYELGLFVGAKELERLQAFAAVEASEEVHLEEAIDWGILGALSEWLGRMLLSLMRYFHDWTGEWGWAIVLVTVCIKVITLPLTIKQMRSMKAMRRIQPQMAAIKEKYADDRVKQGQEMQALFAREGHNPLAGCLPMFVQTPVYFALYAMLGAAVELVHEPFLYLPDLTKQDPYFALPVGLGLMMMVQNRMMPMTGDETQAKIMRWVMPTVLAGFMLFMPSGLAVYMFVNISLSAVQTAVQFAARSAEGRVEAGADKADAKSAAAQEKKK